MIGATTLHIRLIVTILLKLKSYGIRVWAPHGEEADDEEWALVSEDGENCSQGKLQVIMHTQERNSDDHTFIGISYSLVDPSVNVVRHGTKQRVVVVCAQEKAPSPPSTQQTEC